MALHHLHDVCTEHGDVTGIPYRRRIVAHSLSSLLPPPLLEAADTDEPPPPTLQRSNSPKYRTPKCHSRSLNSILHYSRFASRVSDWVTSLGAGCRRYLSSPDGACATSPSPTTHGPPLSRSHQHSCGMCAQDMPPTPRPRFPTSPTSLSIPPSQSSRAPCCFPSLRVSVS
jgi:hypothetical protein